MSGVVMCLVFIDTEGIYVITRYQLKLTNYYKR